MEKKINCYRVRRFLLYVFEFNFCRAGMPTNGKLKRVPGILSSMFVFCVICFLGFFSVSVARCAEPESILVTFSAEDATIDYVLSRLSEYSGVPISCNGKLDDKKYFFIFNETPLLRSIKTVFQDYNTIVQIDDNNGIVIDIFGSTNDSTIHSYYPVAFKSHRAEDVQLSELDTFHKKQADMLATQRDDRLVPMSTKSLLTIGELDSFHASQSAMYASIGNSALLPHMKDQQIAVDMLDALHSLQTSDLVQDMSASVVPLQKGDRQYTMDDLDRLHRKQTKLSLVK